MQSIQCNTVKEFKFLSFAVLSTQCTGGGVCFYCSEKQRKRTRHTTLLSAPALLHCYALRTHIFSKKFETEFRASSCPQRESGLGVKAESGYRKCC